MWWILSCICFDVLIELGFILIRIYIVDDKVGVKYKVFSCWLVFGVEIKVIDDNGFF